MKRLLVVLSLSKNTTYGESGLPENSAPYKGTQVVLVSDWASDQIEPTTSETTEITSTETGATTTAPAATTTEPAGTVPTTTEPIGTTTEPEEPEQETRKPDFEVPGAPVEPADEMPLPDRARALQHRLSGNTKPSQHLINVWLYQHSWIVTGAEFGWWRGSQALELLIAVDRQARKAWGYGAKNEAVARASLARVQSKSR